MKKIYINPATDVYRFNIRDGILMDPSGAGDKVDPVNFEQDIKPGEEIDDEDNSRNGGMSVWDNIW
jgi:hypothetical protein